MGLGKWLQDIGKGLEGGSEPGISAEQLFQQLNKTTKAHNELRSEFDALASTKEEELQKVMAENRRLVGAHNDLVKELGKTKKDLKGDVERLERRIASILDPVGETEKFLDETASG